MEKWGDHQNKNFFGNNSFEALIPFNEGHQDLLKLHVLLLLVCMGWGGGGGGEGNRAISKREFSLKQKNNM